MKPTRFLLPFILLSLFSCSDDIEGLYPDPLDPNRTTFKSSVIVEVFNTAGVPISHTTIRIGETEGTTNNEGILYLNNILLASSSYLTANKEGYYHASRRFYPTAFGTEYIKIILLEDSRIAFFASGKASTLPVEGGVTMHFPADGYMFENGEPYDGIVTVSAKVIAADDPDLSYKMPGDLTGLTTDNTLGVLASLGMVVVELRSSSGEDLQLRKGSEVEMQMKVPASMAATAPLTIPMWYFDETDGIWREEGMGVLNGDTYSASVKHFSYWNFDAWFPIVKWGASFVYENGAPANQMNVCITIPALNTTKCAHTNMDGMVCGMVPANEPLWMEVINTCNEIVYSQPVGPFSDTILMGPITIEGNMEVTAITGRAVNCALEPVIKGYARIAVDGYSHFAVLNELTGAFQMSVLNCGTNSFAISCVDVGDNKLSLPVLYDPAPVINTGDIIVCETNLEYVELEVAGFQDHIYLNFPDVSFFDGSVILYVADSVNTDAIFEIRLDKMTPGLQTPYFAVIGVNLPNGEWVAAREFHISVNITHFGEPGDYILGTLSGTLYPDPGSQGGSQHAFTGKFSILRE